MPHEGNTEEVRMTSGITNPHHTADITARITATCRATLGAHASFLLADAVQETWVRVLQSFASGTGSHITHLTPWLKQVARNTSRDLLRRWRVYTPLEHLGELPSPHVSSRPIDSMMDIERTYQQLLVLLPTTEMGRRQRQILRHAMEGKGLNEIAQLLGISASLVSKDTRKLSWMLRRIEQVYARLMTRLSERQRRILLSAIEGKRGKEIARRLNISNAGVTAELQHIRRELAQLCDSPGEGSKGEVKRLPTCCQEEATTGLSSSLPWRHDPA